MYPVSSILGVRELWRRFPHTQVSLSGCTSETEFLKYAKINKKTNLTNPFCGDVYLL
jgi:hypothetical protein